MINSTGNYYGTSIYASSSVQDILLSIDLTSCINSGKIGCSLGTLYLVYGQQNGYGVNITKCISKDSSGLFLMPYTTATYQYFTISNCTSSYNNIIYINSQGSSIDFALSNILHNTGSPNIFTCYGGQINKVILKNSFFYGNNGVLYFSNSQAQIVRNSYIIHSGTVQSGFTIESCVTTASTSILSPTVIISHYSTYLCHTPYELGILEFPCQTMPETLPIFECPTNPPAPTTCDIFTEGAVFNFVSISSLNHFILSSLLNILK